MIPLFKIYHPIIDYSKFNHNLHGQIVTEFEKSFASYMGVKHAVGVNSCTSAIFLVFKWCQEHCKSGMSADVPSMIPPVVLNSLYHADCDIFYTDDTKWIGSHYYLKKDSVFAIIDSAHEVSKKAISKYRKFGDKWAALYSFYPTKPIAGIDGGMIITNNDDLNDWLRIAIMNGTSKGNSWDRQVDFPGWKYYMSSAQAFAAYQQFARIEIKKRKLEEIRGYYNSKLKLKNTSDHLYTIKVKNNIDFIEKMRDDEIQCGIHYRCTHREQAYEDHIFCYGNLVKSEKLEKQIVSVPFHEDLTEKEQKYIIKKVEECQQ